MYRVFNSITKSTEVSLQPIQREHFDREQIRGGQTRPVSLQEGLPRRTLAALRDWRNPVVEQNPLHGVPTDLVAEVGQGTANPRVTPSRILDGHPHNQLSNRLGCQRPTTATVAGSVLTCVQKRLRKTSGHGKRLIVNIDLTHKGVTP